MKSALLENPGYATPTSQAQHHGAPTQRQLEIDQLASAVGEHALRQVEIDQKMATRIVELRDELSAAKDEIRALRSQVDQLLQALSQGIALARQQSANAARSAFQVSAANLRNRQIVSRLIFG